MTVTAVKLLDRGASNLFHWMVYILANLQVVLIRYPDAHVVFDCRMDFMRITLAKMVPEASRRHITEATLPADVQWEPLPEFFHERCYIHELWTTVFPTMQTSFRSGAAALPEPTDILYISRADNVRSEGHVGKCVRAVLNEAEVVAALGAQPVHFLDMPYEEQVAMVRRARVIIGAHGAALTHVLNITPATTIVELNPNPDVLVHFKALCVAVGTPYVCFGTRSVDADCNMVVEKIDELVSIVRALNGRESNHVKKMKIYTKYGDTGTTRTLVRTKIPKCDAQMEVIGTLDELMAHIGVVCESVVREDLYNFCVEYLHVLMNIGTHFAALNSPDVEEGVNISKYAMVPPTAKLEAWIDEQDAKLPPLKNFILPVGSSSSPGAAQVHVARTVCRRLERRLVSWCNSELKCDDTAVLSELYLPFFNRLSDALFVLARAVNRGHEIIHN